MKRKNTARNISLVMNVVAIIVIAVLMCMNQNTENKLKAELNSEKSTAYTSGYLAATADSTPVKVEVGGSGALISFANGDGYYMDENVIVEKTMR